MKINTLIALHKERQSRLLKYTYDQPKFFTTDIYHITANTIN